MSLCRQQALIEAPVETVWELIGNPARHPEWWPRVMEVKGERFEQDATYRQVTKGPAGAQETTLAVDRLDDLHAIRTRCLDTGTYSDFKLTPAQDGTFLEIELGMEPKGLVNRMFDLSVGSRYFRRWLQESIDGLKAAIEKR